MGQYYYIVNLDKRQFLHPHKLGDGLKLLEFGCSHNTMVCLAVLLADGNGRGGGDLHSKNPLVGSWAGDRIVIAGDYADKGRFVPEGLTGDGDDPLTLYKLAGASYEDISWAIAEAACDDTYIRQSFLDAYWSEDLVPPFLRAEWFEKHTTHK